VTIVTTPFEKVAKAAMQGQGAADMILAVVAHPIAGYDLAGVRQKAEADFAKILQAATQQ
jgi:hypothetical protein